MPSRRGWILAFGAALMLVLVPVLRADIAIPALTARVTDLTATLDPAQTSALESKLAALEQRKGTQLAILLLPSTQPETIEQFAVRAFEQWKLGREKVDDGVLLVVAKTDRKVRIEVGYGLEGAIPDIAANRIINEYLTPHFREGNFYTGIDAATDALTHLIDGEALPEPYAAPAGGSGLGDNALFMIGLGSTVFLNMLLRALNQWLRGLLIGGLVGGLMLLLGLGIPGALLAGVVSAFISYRMSQSSGSSGWSSGSGGIGGGGWSGGGWSSGGGGGGFSGGGGSSGGGGASGSW